ncbi:MAG: bifunctional alpha/beta hydrolase/class I SAM-dependent methyltransferase [Planctomycetota bacterium]
MQTAAPHQTHTFTAPDHTELTYNYWPSSTPTPETPDDAPTLLLFHRGHEHGQRFADVFPQLDLPPNTQTFAWDARGHGQSPGPRGYADGFHQLIEDADAFFRHLQQHHGVTPQNTIVLAHSVGAVLASAWIHSHAPKLRGLILLSPAFRVRLYMPGALPALRLAHKLLGKRTPPVKSYVRPAMLTGDPGQANAYANDPLISRNIAVPVLLGLHDTSSRLLRDAAAIHTPTLLLTSGRDFVVRRSPQRAFFNRLASPTKRFRLLPGLKHDLLHEADAGRQTVIDEINTFIHHRFADPQTHHTPDLRSADRYGHTADEYQRLQNPPATLCPKQLGFAAQRLGLRTLGPLSNGIKLGLDTGFDSGQSLEYVYQNQPRGRLGIGKLLDRAYLNALGWRGIRQRRIHLTQLISDALTQAAADHPERSPHLLELAIGVGRYTLDALEQNQPHHPTATLRDFDPDNLAKARQDADARGLPGLTFRTADAFDHESFHTPTTPEPPADVAVVSGLYELFPENTPVQTSLAGLATAVRPGGYLIYTGQPWHPQLETIARTLNSLRGGRWVMRRRTQAELDQLVAAAGFTKQRTLVDRWGIFTVSLAIREPHRATP